MLSNNKYIIDRVDISSLELPSISIPPRLRAKAPIT